MIFSSLLESIFMHNPEQWAVNKSLENKIDTFQRQLLKTIFNIRYGENGENAIDPSVVHVLVVVNLACILSCPVGRAVNDLLIS